MKGRARVLDVERRHDLLVVVIIAVALALGVVVVGAERTFGTFTRQSTNPSNVLATGSGLWFYGNAAGTTICAGTNDTLGCPFGTQVRGTTVIATFTLTDKGPTGDAYTLAIVNGSGPANISSIVTAKFASNNSTSKTLAAGASDTVNVQLKTKVSTAVGTYTGTILLTDTTAGVFVNIPISVTVQ